MEQVKKKFSLLRLYLIFLKMGCVTFGGGWNILVQVQRQFIENDKAMTAEEITDLFNVARSLPGIMICNLSMFLGNSLAGVAGGYVCTIGMATAPLAILAVITQVYVRFRANVWVAAAMYGVRCCVVPVIVSAMGLLRHGSFNYPPCFVVAAVTFALYVFFDMSSVTLILIGAVCGIAISEYYTRKGVKDDALS